MNDYDDATHDWELSDLGGWDPFEDEDDFWSVGIKDELDPETVKLLNKF